MELKNGDKPAGKIKVMYRYLAAKVTETEIENLQVMREFVEVVIGKEQDQQSKGNGELPTLSMISA